jgi:hypothetical protein
VETIKIVRAKKFGPGYRVVHFDEYDQFSFVYPIDEFVNDNIIWQYAVEGAKETARQFCDLDYIKLGEEDHITQSVEKYIPELEVFAGTSEVVDTALNNLREAEIYLKDKKERQCRKEEKQNRLNEGWVYILKGNQYYKIGKTINLDNRIKQISPNLPFETELICAIRSENITRTESTLHQMFKDFRVNGEWFELNDQDVGYLRDLSKGGLTLEQIDKLEQVT